MPRILPRRVGSDASFCFLLLWRSPTGHSAGISGGRNDAATTDVYYGLAVYTVAKGGLMYEASVGGGKFRYTPM